MDSAFWNHANDWVGLVFQVLQMSDVEKVDGECSASVNGSV
ncbi:hypothetical protein APHCRT_0532 [Anaplasma phagocytophilum str. CRT53-1]|uniref:Uncharacterized protein n=1 Tax=Anaplasma phagocytophilum str. CRT53-1 TaxID=1359157 RepID=A0A0F3Q1W4_ANAPH|nr:hypothetical protein APHCRT_0532 [Anaplasma phagocytophilum str. CRT53-1]